MNHDLEFEWGVRHSVLRRTKTVVNKALAKPVMEPLMSLFDLSSEGVWMEIYRRAVRIYRDSTRSFDDCLEAAITAIQIEMDVWIMG